MRKSTKKTSLRSQVDQRAFDRGYNTAIADFIQFAYEGRTEPFQKIQALGAAKRGRKLPKNGAYEKRLTQGYRHIVLYCHVKWLLEHNKDMEPKDAIEQARQEHYSHAGYATVKKLYYDYRKADLAGKLWVSESDALVHNLPHYRWLRAIAAFEARHRTPTPTGAMTLEDAVQDDLQRHVVPKLKGYLQNPPK